MRHLILAYHAVSATWPSPLAVSERVLRTQLEFLKARGYVGFTFGEWERRRSSGTLPQRSVVVTFDDGYRSTLRARPVLDELGYPGTVFPVVTFVESGAPLSWAGIDHWQGSAHADELQSLDWDELADLKEHGWEVGSHTVTHPRLPTIDASSLARELEDSRAAIAERLGGCETVAYPYGEADARVAEAAERAGYLAGCTLTRAHVVDDSFRRPRVGLYARDTKLRLRAKVTPIALRLRRHSVATAFLGQG